MGAIVAPMLEPFCSARPSGGGIGILWFGRSADDTVPLRNTQRMGAPVPSGPLQGLGHAVPFLAWR
jgi:hypothetical protein